MNEHYIEERVKQKMTGGTVLKAFGMLFSALVVLYLSMAFSHIIPILFMLAIPYLGFAVYFATRCNYEFEYLYFQGELDIDRISAKSSRKRILSVSVKEMEILAPTGSAELKRYANLNCGDKKRSTC